MIIIVFLARTIRPQTIQQSFPPLLILFMGLTTFTSFHAPKSRDSFMTLPGGVTMAIHKRKLMAQGKLNFRLCTHSLNHLSTLSVVLVRGEIEC